MKEKFKKEVLLKKSKTTKSKTNEIKLLDVKLRKLKSLVSRTLDSISTVEVERLQERMEIETYQLTKDRLVQELATVRKDIAQVEDEISIKNEERSWVDWVSRFGISIEEKTSYTEEQNSPLDNRYVCSICLKTDTQPESSPGITCSLCGILRPEPIGLE